VTRQLQRDPDGSPGDWPEPGYAWYAVCVLMVAYTLSYVDRTIVDLLVGPIKADLGLTDTEFSLLRGLAFALFYTLLGIPLGWLADRAHRVRLVAAGIALWSLMTALCGAARSFPQLFLARVGVGVGEAALTPAAYSMIADYFPPERRGRALGVYAIGVYVGIGLAIIIGGLVVQAISTRPALDLPLVGEVRAWQAAFMIVGAPGLLVALWMLTIREPRRRTQPGEHGLESLGATLRFLWRHRATFAAHFAGFGLLTLLFNAISAWIPAYLTRVHGFGPGRIAMTYGPLLLLFGSAGIYCGGWLADRLRARGVADAEMRAGLVGALCLWPFAATATLMPGAGGFLLLLAPLLFFASFPFAAAAAALQLVTPNRMRGQVSAVYLFVVNLTGIGLGGTITALLTDGLFGREDAVGYSMALVGAVVAPLAALALRAGLPHFRRSSHSSG
jgi:MFS family permease